MAARNHDKLSVVPKTKRAASKKLARPSVKLNQAEPLCLTAPCAYVLI